MKENSEKIGTKFKESIHHSNIEKWAVINASGMRLRRNKEREKLWDV